MRKKIVSLLVVLAMATFATSAMCATASLNLSGTFNSPPITVSKVSDMSLKVYKTTGKTSYVDTDTEWQTAQTVPAKFRANADLGVTVQTTVPANATATAGADSVQIGWTCRTSTTASPVLKSDGIACSTSAVTHVGTGDVYMSLIPDSAVFSTNNATGGYAGTVTVVFNY